MMTFQGSEVAALMAQIRAEYDAGRAALYDLSAGTSRHEIITARMERMGTLHEELRTLVGDAAMEFVVIALNEVKPS
jgi:hypothetical protein